ncbi:MAG: peptidoglycan editing factor PgeF [Halieaceae bacterium]|jgi:YfiH family protein|nr:peptidoglycan editing factor PgeF [Halieaceae bacterium]
MTAERNVIEVHFASGVRALSTTRRGGVSTGSFADWNLGDHVGDQPEAVQENRRRLSSHLPAGTGITWLEQVHGTRVVHASTGQGLKADAIWTDNPDYAGAVMTADCLPVVFAAKDGSCAAVSHAGWRGLAAGVLTATLEALPVEPGDLEAWLGPAIGPSAFEVGNEVREAFIQCLGEQASRCFIKSQSNEKTAERLPGAPMADSGGKWLCDLFSLARLQLQEAGLESITGGDRCTFSEPNDFFSYRRDGQTGRMATVVWLTR